MDRCFMTLHSTRSTSVRVTTAFIAVLTCFHVTLRADEPKERFEVSEEVKEVLVPLFSAISKADVSRATVRLSAETVMNGVVVETEESTYQIASRHPDAYTIYYKAPDQRRRLYCDGRNSVVALSTTAFLRLPGIADCQEITNEPPIDLGTYPEPVLSLSLAGVDPAFTFLSGMRSVRLIERTKFRGRTDSVRLRGVQDDGVTWDLWLTTDEQPQPLRLLVDLTPMLTATKQVAVPEGYGHSLRYDFLSWRISGEVDDRLFTFAEPESAIEYKSMESYARAQARQQGGYELLGQRAPGYDLTLLSGKKVSHRALDGKVVVLDFWSTWCGPCLEAMPTIESSWNRIGRQDVVVVAVNVGEFPAHVKGFSGELDWKLPIAVDPKGELAEIFKVQKIPLTILISPDGIIEAAHVGFPGKEALAELFAEEFEILLSGGKIASSPD